MYHIFAQMGNEWVFLYSIKFPSSWDCQKHLDSLSSNPGGKYEFFAY